MRKFAGSVFVLAIISVLSGFSAAQNRRPSRLADVSSIYIDERSFNFTFSSCGKTVNGMVLVCAKHAGERDEFLIALKRWLVKSGFTLAPDKDAADGIVQGTLSIDDTYRRDNIPYPDEEQRRKAPLKGEAEWSVSAWAINQDGRRIWTLGYDYPGISFKPSERAKIEGKRLAKSLEYDFKKKR